MYAIATQSNLAFARQMTDAAHVLEFALAGNARLTLVSKASGQRFTYRVRQPKADADGQTKPHFVQVLTGPDNTASYEFLGTIFKRIDYKQGGRSRIGFTAPSAVAWRWFWQKLIIGSALPDQLEVWHEGRCGRCGRALTVPESIARGIGPECAEYI
jgi:hypothetical protein